MEAPSKLKFFNAASFSVAKRKGYKSVELIISIIAKSVAEQQSITRDDIYLLYWLYKTDHETKEIITDKWISGLGVRNVTLTKEEFIHDWRMQRNAVGWFRSSLSSAILEGKLLVLPIIEI